MRHTNQKAFLILSLFLGIFLLFSLPVSGETYYVDFTTGLDTDSGLTEELAWKTWNFVRAQTFTAGDSILFKRGETWTVGSNQYWTFTDSGTAEDYITIDAYGEGVNPILDCEIEMVAKTWIEEVGEGVNIWSTAWTVRAYRCRLDGVDSYTPATAAEIDGSTYLWHYDGVADKLYVYATEDPSTAYTNIKIASHNNWAFYPSGCSYVKLQNLRIHSGIYAFRFHATNDETYIEINDCDIWYGYSGIMCEKTAGGGGTANYVTVDGCDIDTKLNLVAKVGIAETGRCINDGIYIYNECNNWAIKNCTITDWGHNGAALMAQASSSQGTNDCIIELNTFNGSNSPYMRAMTFAGIDGKCDSNIFRYNIITATNVRNHVGGQNSEVYYNLFYGLTEEGVTDKSDISEAIDIAYVDAGMTCDAASVYNNIFYDVHDEAITMGASITNCLVKNNIMMKCGEEGNYRIIGISAAIGVGNVISYNCIYNANTLDTISYKGVVCTVVYANANHAEFSNNISADPLFVDVSVANFHLGVGSPCIDAGVGVGLTIDYEGNPVGALPDIGAYELLDLIPPIFPYELRPAIIPIILPIIK